MKKWDIVKDIESFAQYPIASRWQSQALNWTWLESSGSLPLGYAFCIQFFHSFLYMWSCLERLASFTWQDLKRLHETAHLQEDPPSNTPTIYPDIRMFLQLGLDTVANTKSQLLHTLLVLKLLPHLHPTSCIVPTYHLRQVSLVWKDKNYLWTMHNVLITP